MDNLRGLWRGKRLDNKVWVEGYYLHLSENDLHIIVGLDGQYNRIEPETRGECASMTDKNGVKIFEGDIIQTKHGRLCEVVWRSNSAVNCWDIYPLECKHRSPDEWDLWGSKNLLVVGNIHDNPELLK